MNKSHKQFQKFKIKLRGKICYPIYVFLFNCVDSLFVTSKNNWCFFFTEKHFSDNIKYYYDYINNNDKSVVPILIVKNKRLYELLKTDYVRPHIYYYLSIRALYYFLKSSVVIIAHGGVFFYYLPYVLNVKRKLIVNLWHGIPLKKLCMEVDDFREMGKGCYLQDNSLFIASSKMEQKMLSKCFLLDENKIKITGTPRNDVFFQHKMIDSCDNQVKILYAPTWREFGNSTQFFPFSDFDLHDLISFCEVKNIKFYVRAHRYDMESLNRFLNQSGIESSVYEKYIEIADQTKYPDNQQLLIESDILITDYSSIYLDYLLLDKPVVFIPYDLEEYSNYRGFLFDYEDYTPGPKVFTYSSFKEEIVKIISLDDDFKQKRTQLKDVFHSQFDGKNSERITAEINQQLAS